MHKIAIVSLFILHLADINRRSLEFPCCTRVILVNILFIFVAIVLLTMLPELGCSNTELLRVHFSLVPENTVLKFIALRCIVNDEALVVLSTLVHHLTEEFKGGKGRPVVVIDALAVGGIGLTKNENIVYVSSESRLNTEGILHSNQEEDLEPTTVHEEVLNVLVVCPGIVIHTVVENHKGSGVNLALFSNGEVLLDFVHNEFLAFTEICQNNGTELSVNEERRNHLSVETVRLFCTTNNRAERHILVVVKEVTNEGTLTCTTATNENGHSVLRNLLHFELSEGYIHSGGGCHCVSIH